MGMGMRTAQYLGTPPESAAASCCRVAEPAICCGVSTSLHPTSPLPPALLQGLEEAPERPLPSRLLAGLGRRLLEGAATALHSPSRRSLQAVRRLQQRQQASLAAWKRQLQRQLVAAEAGDQAGLADPAAAGGGVTSAAGAATAGAGEGAPSAAAAAAAGGEGGGEGGGGPPSAAGAGAAAAPTAAAAGPAWLAGPAGLGQAQGSSQAQLPGLQHKRLVWLSRRHYERARGSVLTGWQQQRKVGAPP